jgi:hypothetical protein
MKDIRADRLEILEIVKKNRTQHRAVFEEALANYMKMAVAELEKSVADAKAGRKFSRHVALPEPIDQTPEYDRAIRMLELSKDDFIELDEQSFANLVMDTWHWTKNWATTNSGYVGTVANTAYLSTKLA